MPRATGTERECAKEQVEMTIGECRLFNVLCVSEDLRIDEGVETEDDSGDASLMSSQAGSVVAAREYDSKDGEQNKEEMEASVEQNLKKMANVQKKKPSAFLFKYLLGIDGEDAMHGLKEMHKTA